MTLVAAILLGLRRRDQTGKGGWVGTSLYANGAWANGTTTAGAAIGAKLPPRQPPDRPRNALTNLYRTKDDRWLQLLMVRDDRLWDKFCAAIGRPELATDPRFADREERKVRAQELHDTLAPVFAGKTYAEWVSALSPTGLPFADTTNPEVPRTINNPIRLGFAKPRVSGPPAAVGENNDEILRELGHSEAEIEALKKAGVFG
jgi:crotonobetainyl-CoA:carnitine CoA-transferase CaiB-like acyl-CoA transferase